MSNSTNQTTFSTGSLLDNDEVQWKVDINNITYSAAGFLIGVLLTGCVFLACVRLQRRQQRREQNALL